MLPLTDGTSCHAMQNNIWHCARLISTFAKHEDKTDITYYRGVHGVACGYYRGRMRLIEKKRHKTAVLIHSHNIQTCEEAAAGNVG